MIDGGPPLLVNGNPADHCMETRWHSSSSHHGHHHHHQCWLTRRLLALSPLIWPVSGQVLLIFLINTPANVPRNGALKQKRLSSIYYFQHFSTLALGHFCHDVLAPAAGWNLQKPSRAEGNLVKVFFLYCSVLYDLNITDIVSKPGQFMNRNLGKFPSALDFYLSIV